MTKAATAARFAPLTGGLLARKGEARPAMRAAVPGLAGDADDLGWNDMGAPLPVRQQAALAAALASPDGDGAALPAGKSAAFTLRLSAERHLRLRLACAVTHKSAQAFVTEALDAMLNAMPALDALADVCPADTPGKTVRGATR